MIPSQDLFNLIKSLSRTEKRYFKTFTRLHIIGEQNNYLHLFDEIEKQKKYDEGKLLKTIESTDKRRFAVAKNYLYNQVLKMLRVYHHSIHSKVKDLLRDVEILYEKGLYTQAEKTIRKAKVIAKEHDMHWAQLEITNLYESRLAIQNNNIRWLEEIRRDEAEEIICIKNTKSYRDLFFSITTHYFTSGVARNKHFLEKLSRIIKNKYLQNESLAKTFTARLYFNYSHSFYAFIKGDEKNLYRYSKAIINLYDLHSKKIKLNASSYLSHMQNMITACTSMHKYDEIPSLLDKLEQLSAMPNMQNHSQFFYVISCARLDYFTALGLFSESVSKRKHIIQELKKHETLISDANKIALFSIIAVSCFGSADFKASIHWMNRIRNEFPPNSLPDFENFLHIFYLIVHYEVGNTKLLPYLIRAIHRFLKEKKELYKFETIIIHFLRNELPKTNTKKELILAFQKLKNKIVPLAKDAHEKNALDYFDYVSWLESKIENRAFSEVVREKAGR